MIHIKKILLILLLSMIITSLWKILNDYINQEWTDVSMASQILAMNASRHARIDIIEKLLNIPMSAFYSNRINAYKLALLKRTNNNRFQKEIKILNYHKPTLDYEVLYNDIISAKNSDNFYQYFQQIKQIPIQSYRTELYIEMAKKFIQFKDIYNSIEILKYANLYGDKIDSNIPQKFLFDLAEIYIAIEDEQNFINCYKKMAYSRKKVLWAISLINNKFAIDVFKNLTKGKDLSYKRTNDPMFVSDEKIASYPVELNKAFKQNNVKQILAHSYTIAISLNMNLYVYKLSKYSYPIIAYAAHFYGNDTIKNDFLKKSLTSNQLYDIRNGMFDYAELLSITFSEIGHADYALSAISRLYPKWKRSKLLKKRIIELSKDGKYLDSCLIEIQDMQTSRYKIKSVSQWYCCDIE